MKIFRIFLLIVVISLVAARIALPYYLLRYVQAQVNKIPDYQVKIADLDVHLYRGAYTLKNIQLWKITKNIAVPFYKAKRMDFSIEWSALLHGHVVAKIMVDRPTINFVTDPSGKNEQLTISKEWLEVVKSLYPLNINRMDAHNGEVAFISFKGNPPFKIYVTNAEFEMENMQKATQDNKLLSSSFMFKGDVIGGGTIVVKGKFDPFKKQPTFDLKVELQALKVSRVANFLKHYSDVDVSGGIFSLYGEAAAANGKIDGYVKPFIKNLKIGNPKKKTNPLNAIVDGAASVVAKILQNPQQKTIATKINIQGSVNEPDTNILSIIGYLIRHAFIQALLPQVDHSVTMQDVIFGKQPSSKNPFPSYRN